MTGLAGNTAYTFQIQAVNAAGPGAASDGSEPATPMGPPLASTGVSATAGVLKAALAWANSSDTTITKYQYQRKEGSGAFGTWTDIPLSDASTTSYDVMGLTVGTTYTFQVRAVNAAGPGAATDTLTVTPVGPPPLAPTGVSATAGVLEAALAWANPSDTTITKYQYRQSTDRGRTWSPDWTDIADSGATTTSHTVTGLTVGTTYTFQVRAVNAAGPGAGTYTQVTVTPAAPAAPTEFRGGHLDEGAFLSWTVADDNGASIPGYQYQQKEVDGNYGNWINIPDSAPGGANRGSFEVMGLSNGTQYIFKLRAVNSVGEGAETGETSMIPRGVPLTPTDFSATSRDASVLLSRTAADDNGLPITKYQYQQDGGNWINIDNSAPGGANAVSYTVTGLTNGNTYTFKLRAVGIVTVGAGAETGETSATPAASEIDLWSATLTVGKNSGNEWYEFGGNHDSTKYGTLVLQRQFIWKGDFREQLEPDNVLP